MSIEAVIGACLGTVIGLWAWALCRLAGKADQAREQGE